MIYKFLQFLCLLICAIYLQLFFCNIMIYVHYSLFIAFIGSLMPYIMVKGSCFILILPFQTIYLEQSKKIQENWTRLEYFDIVFCVLFDHYCQSFISTRETGLRLKIEIFLMRGSHLA